jgi:hypothetical protein
LFMGCGELVGGREKVTGLARPVGASHFVCVRSLPLVATEFRAAVVRPWNTSFDGKMVAGLMADLVG